MTPESFTYWLHGYFEISGSNYLTENQVQIIKDHLDLCFKKVTPPRKVLNTEEIREAIKQVRKDSTRNCAVGTHIDNERYC